MKLEGHLCKEKFVNTRGNIKTKFKLMTKCSSKYLNSPLYKGSLLWDSPTVEIQRLPTTLQFIRPTSDMYRIYKDFL